MNITPKRAKEDIPDINSRLLGILKRTHSARRDLKSLREEAHSVPQGSSSTTASRDNPFIPKKTCLSCMNREEEDKCVRKIMVKRISNLKAFKGCILTFAEGKERLRPNIGKVFELYSLLCHSRVLIVYFVPEKERENAQIQVLFTF
jgi:hypothetical protein